MSAAPTWTLRAGEAGYPAPLADLEGPGLPLIHGRGCRAALTGLDEAAIVTIVGSRRASPYGLRTAERLARELAAAGVVVVSGMALGIDAAAHRGALDGGGITIAVLAGGPDVVYPVRHRGLYQRIIERGAVISEYGPGTAPQKGFFPARNRLMAALGKVIVIVEAAQPSGSLITADEASKLGRAVGAVPGSVEARVAAGANSLLADGAYVIREARDVLDLLFGPGGIPPGSGLPPVDDRPPPRPRVGPALDRADRRVLDLVETGVSTVDRVAVAAGVSARDATLALARLELLGYVTASAIGGFERRDLTAPSLDSEA